MFGLGAEHVLQGHQAPLAVNARERPGGIGECSEDPGHLLPHSLQQRQFLFEIPVVTGQGGREAALVEADQEGSRLCDNTLHPMAPGLLTVHQMTDDFQRAPLAGHRASQKLLGAEIGNGAAEGHRALKIGLDQTGWSRHGGFSSSGKGTKATRAVEDS